MLNYTITIAISAFFVPHYLGGLFWDELRHGPADILFAIALIGLLSAVNVRGVKESAGVNVGLAVVDFLTQLLLVAVGLFLVFKPQVLIDNVHWGIAPTWKDFFIAIPVGMIAYTGIETISNMAEEAKDEETTIPRAINRVVIAVFAIYSLLPMVALSALPVVKNADGQYVTQLGLPENQGGFAGDPVLGVVKHFDLGFLQGPAELYVGVLAATILLIASNAGIIGVSRLVYSMGIHRQVPDRLRQLHPRYGTPYIGIMIFGGIACIAVIPGKAEFLGNMYAFGAMLSFTIAHLAVIRLRLAKPDQRRPWRGPGNIELKGGRSIPLFAVFGGIGTLLAFLVVTALHLDVALAGIGWLTLGKAIYPIYRKRQGLDLTTTTRVAVQRPVVEHEAEYESVVVALDAHQPYPRGAIATAAKVAARRRRGIHVLVYIAVPQSAPIYARMPEAEQAAESIIEQARLQGGRRVTGHVEKVRPGQAGRMIVREARELRAQAIVAPLPPRTGGTLFGKTLETVLAERPCRVIIQSDPAERRPARPPAVAA
jgi:APA family basic amino acid/polyamine antiporter